MVEIIPILLFILGWHPQQPGKIDLQRPEIVFTEMAQCEAAGTAMVQRMNASGAEQSGARYEFRCMAAPSAEEYEAAFRDLPGGSE